MSTRREARERALELLYEAAMKSQPVTELLAELPVNPDPLSSAIATGVGADAAALDLRIEQHLRSDWRLDRLPLLERLILRIGLWELASGDAPRAVVLSEAVELAKRYGGDDSAKFVNGLLAAAAPAD